MPLEPVRRAAARRVQDEQRRAGPDERHGQRDDDVRHPGDHDEGPLIAPSSETEDQDAEDDGDAERLGLVLHEDGGGHARERHHRADRQVDAAGDDDDRLGDRREGERQGPDRQALDLGSAVARLDEHREDEQADEQGDQRRASRCCGASSDAPTRAGPKAATPVGRRSMAVTRRLTGLPPVAAGVRRRQGRSAATSSGIGTSGGRS